MIRILTSQDNNKLMEFLKGEPEYNLYIIGDLENFGYDKSFQKVYGELDDEGKFRAVLMKYFSIFIVYAKGAFDVEGFAKIIKNYRGFEMLCGKWEVASQFEKSSLRLGSPEINHFAVLEETNPDFQVAQDAKIEKATTKDIDRILALRRQIKELPSSKNLREILLKSFEAGTARGYYVEIENEIASYAQSAAENSLSAMIVSVMTEERHRGKGLASACLKALCEDLLEQKKTVCLFYLNPQAGIIYKQLGFKDIGLWGVYRISPTDSPSPLEC